MTSFPSISTEVDDKRAMLEYSEGCTIATQPSADDIHTLPISFTDPKPLLPAERVIHDEIPHPDILPEAKLDERGDVNGSHNQHSMINIPEHENECADNTMHRPLHLSDYSATGNYTTGASLGLEMLARFANPVNALDIFNSIDKLSDATYFPQSTMQKVVDVPMAINNPINQTRYLEPSPLIQEPTRISAYAKLIFEDGFFYMNTYSVVLGRDLQAWHAAMRDEKRKQRQLENGTLTRDPKTPVRVKNEGSRYTRSIVSESGGILRTGNDLNTEERARRRKLRKIAKNSAKSKSTGSSSPNARQNSNAPPSKVKIYEAQNLQSTISQSDGPVPVDPATLRPSPYDCPLVAIHPPTTAPISAYKSISREHVKITFNSKKSKFEAHIIGRNGCFVQDHWYHTNDIVPLESGDFLQVGGITVQFMLPNQLDPTTVVEYSDSSDEANNLEGESEDNAIKIKCSDKHQNRSIHKLHGNRLASAKNCGKSCDENSDSDEEDQYLERNQEPTENMTGKMLGMKRDRSRKDGTDDPDEADAGGLESSSNLALSLKLGKKRGPGRPPKNGILSKREQKLLKKEEQILFEAMVKEGVGKTLDKESKKGKGNSYEVIIPPGLDIQEYPSKICMEDPNNCFIDESIEKSVENSAEDLAEKSMDQLQSDIPTKNKVGRPRKHPILELDIGPPREKRKYTKRKPKEPKDCEVNGSGSGEDCKSKKEKVPPRPPRSPSPVMNEEDYTPEQLAKPQSNYVTLIHEALSNAPTQQLGLPDIYRAIYRKYPYFKFKTQTLGWQSSVRHNLSQHHAFRKVEKDGKGWTWGIVDGISIEKEKKKRATPPPQSHLGQIHHQPLYQSGNTRMIGSYPHGQVHGYPVHNIQSSQSTGYQNPPQIHGQPLQMSSLPLNFIPSIPPQLAAPNVPTSYSSPYAPRPVANESTIHTKDPTITVEQKQINTTNSIINVSEKMEQQIQNNQCKSDDGFVISTHSNELKEKVSQGHTQSQPVTSEQHPTTQTQGPASSSQSLSLESQATDKVFNSVSSPQQPVHNQKPAQTAAQGIIVSAHINEDVIRATETFKKNLLDSLKSKQSETIVNSAINRVLGITTQSDLPGNSQEDMIMAALRSLLSKIPGSNIEAEQSYPTVSQMMSRSAEVSKLPHHNLIQGSQSQSKVVAPDKSLLGVTRPTFTTQGTGRFSIPMISRPPMIAAGMKTQILDPSNHALPHTSTSPNLVTPTSGSVSGVDIKHNSFEDEKKLGQKRTHDGTDDLRDYKKPTTSSS